MQDNRRLLRYEFKYFINHNTAKELLNQSLSFMKLDKFVEKKEIGYKVRSLYFDNNVYDNFYEKVDGVQIRKKFRLRTYNTDISTQSPIFLEIKGRSQDRVIKERTLINKSDLDYFYELKDLDLLLKKNKTNKLVKQFIYEVYKKKIKPKIIIDYNRIPLVNKYGLYFRLTFDTNIITGKSKYLFKNTSFYSPLEYKPGYTILEVKFERSIPAWFHRLIQTHDLKRKSISKFAIGICNCKIRDETST